MLRNTIRAICKDTNQTVSEAKKNYVENSEEFSQKFSEQNRSHNENMSIIRDQYNKLSAVYKRKMENLTEKLEKDEYKLGNITSKRKLELEGFHSDLQNLEKRMAFYQTYIGKLKKLVDKDQEGKNIFGEKEDGVILE